VEIYQTLEALVEGRLRTGDDAVWDLQSGAVGLGKISPKVSRSFVRRVGRVRSQIIAGKIKVPASLS
jgi:hypothetical protein